VLGWRGVLRLVFAVAVAGAVLAGTTPANGATTTYGPKSGTVSADSGSRYVTYSFWLSGPKTIDATLVWPTDVDADLNLVIKDPSHTTVASTTTDGPNPEHLVYDYTGTAKGKWFITVFARRGTANFDLSWTLGPSAGGAITTTTLGGVTTTTSTTAKSTTTSTTTKSTTTTTTRPSGGAPISNYLRVFTAQNIGTSKNSFTEDEAKQVASNFDVIIATPGAFNGLVPAMRSANPRVRVIAYVNSAFVGKTQGPSSGAFPAAWYMRDAGGNPVQSKYDNYMMDVSNAEWTTNRETTCKQTAEASGYDGCSLDMLGTAPLDSGYTKTTPINPATKKPWTEAEYYKATTKLAKAVHDYASPLIVSGNGLRSGSSYFDAAAPSKQLFDGTADGIAEAFVRPGPAGVSYHRTEAQWKQDVDMLVDAGRNGHGVCTLTKVWSDGTQAQKDAVHEFTLATFLMGTNGRSFFYLSYQEDPDSTVMHPWWKSNIGTPTGAYPDYAKVGDVYVRTFTNGVVVVNPTSAASNVTLPSGSWRDVNGGAVRSGTTSVPATTGWVLLK
jgi:hypothetical protein